MSKLAMLGTPARGAVLWTGEARRNFVAVACRNAVDFSLGHSVAQGQHRSRPAGFACTHLMLFRGPRWFSVAAQRLQRKQQPQLVNQAGVLDAVPHEWGTLHPHLIQALLAHGFTHPTEIQKLAKAAVFSKKDVLLHGQTGCGKTLAYLLPLLHRMKRNEEVSGDSRARPKQPRMIILVPTRELGVQVRMR
eukprot:693741-Rhodomonas_salina.2